MPLSAEAQAKADAKKKKKAAQKAKAAAAAKDGAAAPAADKKAADDKKKADEKAAKAKKEASDAKKAKKAEEEEDDEDADGEVDPSKEDLRNPDVVTKYRAAGDIANDAMKAVIAAVAAGKKVVELCDAGDKFITEATGKVFATQKSGKDGKKVKVEKGVAFPTSVSVNHIVGHFSPLSGEAAVLKVGDLIKIDLGVHIDGYAALLAHTMVVADAKDEKTKTVTGKGAQVLTAAHTAAEIALRMLKPGATNTSITDAIAKVASAYKVQAVQGVLSHQLKHFIIDGEKVILNRADPEQKVEEFKFETNEVYALDIVMSTAEGKPKESELRTTIYKRAPETHYSLRVKYSRQLLADIDERFPAYPFTLRALDEKTAKIGIADMVTHNLVHAYPVLTEKEGQLVAHIKLTAALLPTGTVRLTSSFVDTKLVVCPPDVKLTDEALLKTLAEPVRAAGAKNRKKKPAAAGAAAAGDKKDAKAAPAAAAPAAGAGAAAAAKPAAK